MVRVLCNSMGFYFLVGGDNNKLEHARKHSTREQYYFSLIE